MSNINPEEESLILAALRRAYTHSPFWRDRLSGIGVDKTDFVPGFSFTKLPPLNKKDILSDQEENPPFGRLLSVEPNKIRRIHKTSGTSAKPFIVTLTDEDILDTYMTTQRAFLLAGMGLGQRVVHCLSFNMWSGGVTDYMPIEQTGATAIPFGVGNTALLLHLIRDLGVNAISSTPSYMFTLRDRCKNELGIDPKDLGLKYGYFGGEGLLQVPGVRDEIEITFGMTAFDANYGMSELLSVIAGEGPERNGMVYHGHGVLFVEMIDADGNPVPIVKGAMGELLFTTLRREGQPLFRYRSNDIAEILWSDLGEDGLLRMRFRIVGRSDEMLIVKGVNFFPQSLLSVLPEFEPRISREFRVVRPQGQSPEDVCVIMETDVEPGSDLEDITTAIRKRVAEMLQVRISIEWVSMQYLPREGNKTRFVIDDPKPLLQ